MFDFNSLFTDFVTATSLYAMLAAAGSDIVAGTYEALANHTFKFTLFAGWLDTKVVKGILPVILMYAASLGVSGTAHDGLVVLARLGASAFIAAQIASIYSHFKAKPPEDVVPPEDPVPPEVVVTPI